MSADALRRLLRLLSLGLLLILALTKPAAAERRGGPENGTPSLRLQPWMTAPVLAVALSPDGRRLVSGQADGTLRVWDVESGRELRTLSGHAGAVPAIAFSPDGRLLASADSGRQVASQQEGSGERHRIEGAGFHLWDAVTGELLASVEAEGVTDLVFTADGRRLVTCTGGPVFWEVPTLRRLRDLMPGATQAPCQTLTLAPDGRRLLTASSRELRSKSLRIWNLASGRMERHLKAPISSYGPVSFHPGGRFFASLSQYGLHVWDFAEGEVVRLLIGLKGPGTTVAYSPDGRFLASGTYQEASSGATGVKSPTLHLWDAESGEKLHDFSAFEGNVNALAWSSDGTYLISASDIGLTRWETISGRKIADFFTAKVLATQHLSFTPDGRHLFTASRDGWASFWDLRSGERTGVRAPVAAAARVAASVGGHRIASVVQHEKRHPRQLGTTYSATVHLWSARADGDAPREAFLADARLLAVAMSPGGQTLVSAASTDGEVVAELQVRDAAGGKPTVTLGSHRLRTLVFALGGRTLATGGGGDGRSELLLWDTASGELLARRGSDGSTVTNIHTSPLLALAFSPDNRWLASGSADGTLQVWDVERSSWGSRRPRVEKTFGGDGTAVTALAFAGERILASGDTEGRIRLWDPVTGAQRRVLSGHSGPVRFFAVSPDGETLASAGDDRVVRLWDLATGEERLALLTLADGDDAILLTPDLRYMATRDSRDLISFAVGDDVFPFEQFDLRLHRPDLVVARLPAADPELVEAYRRARERRLLRLGYSEEMLGDDFHLPTLRLLDTGSLPAATSEPRARLSLEADDSRFALRSLHVWVNGVPEHGSRGREIEGRRRVRLDVDVALAAGENRIEAAVRNERGAESLLVRRRILSHRRAGDTNLYVLAVGVALYADAEQNLHYSAKDAEDVAALFRRSRRPTDVHTRVLVDFKATADEILASRTFLEQAGIDDQVVFFVAGHGVRDESGDYYFAPHDMDFADPGRRGIAYEDLEGLVDGLASRKKLMMIDTCFSGEIEAVVEPSAAQRERFERAFRRGAKLLVEPVLETGPRLETLFVDLRRGTGTTVISAAAGRQFAWEEEDFRNGYFTYSVRQGIMTRAADRDDDGRIMASELREYVTLKVLEASRGGQRPTLRRENLAHDFQVW